MMDKAKVLIVIIWSLPAFANHIDDPACLTYMQNKADKISTCLKAYNISIKVTCQEDECPVIDYTCQSKRTTAYFERCNSPQILKLLDSIHVNYMNEIRNLTLDKSSLIEIPDHFFSNWSRQLETVDIKHTKLQKIRKDDFAHLVNIEELMLHGNKIRNIEAGAFDNLSKLKILDLGENRLYSLPSGIFRHLSRLDKLSLSENPIENLPSDLFTGIDNCAISEIHINMGSLNTLPPGFFKSLTHLKKVGLQGNQLQSLPTDIFYHTSMLVELNLRNNSLRTLPTDFFNSSTALADLDLSRNLIETLPLGIFGKLVSLNKLDISFNNLTNLRSGFFEGLTMLKSLNASHNNLITVDDDLCNKNKSMGAINSIDFSFNGLTFQATSTHLPPFLKRSIFYKCFDLIEIYLSNNKATQVFDDFFNRTYIDLRNNNLSELTATDNWKRMSRGTLDLRNNQISKIDLTQLESITGNYVDLGNKLSYRNLKILLGNNPLHCNCHLIAFVRYWKSERNSELRKFVKLTTNDVGDDSIPMTCSSPDEFKNRDISSIRPEDLSCSLKTDVTGDVCSNSCVACCACREYPAERVLTLDCSHRNLSQLPAMISNERNWTIKLNMSHNSLRKSPSLAEPHLINVTSLDLSNNNISMVTFDLFSKKLANLRLHNNSISRLDDKVIKYLENNSVLRAITLHQNPWQCDCEARNFLSFIQRNGRVYKFEKVSCYGTNQALYNMTVRDVCKDAIAVIVGVSVLVAFFGIIIGILAALHYKYQKEIKIWLYSKQWCLWFVTEDELDKDKKYDAFVSFSHKDEDFVEKEIVAKLEDGPRPFKLCLHYRDWLAGEWIPVQISQSVEDSRRTIVVLSPNFLESVWGRMEFRTAHTQALKEGRARVIIILYGDIENMADLDPELKAYLSLNTYIKWGDPWFWDKLRYALPHRFEPSKRRTRNARLIEQHLALQLVNKETDSVIAKSNVISMSKLANDSQKLLGSDGAGPEDRMPASC